MKRLNYTFWIVMTIPFVFLGVVTGLIETMLGTSGDFTTLVVKPFTWAYERKCGGWNAMGDGQRPSLEEDL